VQQAGPLRVQLHTHGLAARLPPATEVALYRMVQELLTNVGRHAQASQVLVQLMRHPGALHLVVEDDGRGFEPGRQQSGVGLRSVRARAAYLGGTLEVQSAPGRGTTVSFELALPAATE
jgi:signal transduction histidine kinase